MTVGTMSTRFGQLMNMRLVEGKAPGFSLG